MTVNSPGNIPAHHVLGLYAGLDSAARATHHIMDGLVDENAELRNEVSRLNGRIDTALNALHHGNEAGYATIRSILTGTDVEAPF